MRDEVRRRFAAPLIFAALIVPAGAQTPPDGGQLAVKPPPVPTGVVPLPAGPPSTASQAPVPSPARALPGATDPLAWSPDLAAIGGAVRQGPITLSDAIAIALYTNRSFAAAVAALEVALARTGEAKALLNPNIGVSGALTQYDQATIVSFAGSPIVIQKQFNPVYTAAFSLPIDIAGTLRSAASQAQFNDVAARIDVNRVRNQIVFDVKLAFYNVLRAQAQVGVANDNLTNALVRLSLADKNYSAGTSARFDVLTAQTAVANAQQTLITAKASVSTNLAALKNTIGLDMHSRLAIKADGAVETPPDLTPTATPNQAQALATVRRSDARAGQSTPPVAPATPPAGAVIDDDFDFGPEYDTLLKEALATRPEVLETTAQVSAARHGVQYARRSALPSMSIDLDYIYTPNATLFTREHVDAATLNVSVPIWDGNLARERVREARAQTAQAVVNSRQAKDQVVLDVQQAYIALVQARQKVAVAKVEVTQALEALRVGRVRYESGVSQQSLVSPQLELSNSQIGLTQAEANQVDALYDYNTARAQLDRALGRYAFTGAAPGYQKPRQSSATGGNP